MAIDLSGLRFCDSSGISALIAARNHAHAAGTELVLAAVPVNVSRMFAITGLSGLFTTAPDLQDTIKARPAGGSGDPHRGHRRTGVSPPAPGLFISGAGVPRPSGGYAADLGPRGPSLRSAAFRAQRVAGDAAGHPAVVLGVPGPYSASSVRPDATTGCGPWTASGRAT